MYRYKKTGSVEFYRHRQDAIKNDRHKKILVTGLNTLGELLMATPFLHHLRILFPGHAISLLSTQYGVETFKHSSDIDELLVLNDVGVDTLPVLSLLEEQHFDILFDTQENYPTTCPDYFIKIQDRAGFVTNGKQHYFTHPVAVEKGISKTLKLISLLSPFHHRISDLSPHLHLYASAEESAEAHRFLKQHGVSNGEFLIGLSPGGFHNKSWSDHDIIVVGKFLENTYNARCILFAGSTDNKSEFKGIAASVSDKAICVHLQNLLETAEIIRRCKFVLTDDLDLTWLSASVGTPSLTLTGTDQRMLEQKPEGEFHVFLNDDALKSPDKEIGKGETLAGILNGEIDRLINLQDKSRHKSSFRITDEYYSHYIATSEPDETVRKSYFKGPMQSGKDESEFTDCADYARKILLGETLVFRVRLDIARICNFKCRFCFSSFHQVPFINKKNQIMSLDTLRILSAQFNKLGVRHLNLYGGGEPTLHPCFADVLEIFAENDLRIQLITNGSGLNAVVNHTIVKYRSKFDTIRISMPGLSSRSHRLATKSITYDKITAHARELIKELKLYQDIPQVGIYVPVMDIFTGEEIETFLQYAKNAEFDWVFFREDTRFPPENPDDGCYPEREHQLVRDLVAKVSAGINGLRVFYATPFPVPNKASACYFQLTDRCLALDPKSKKLITTCCEHHVPVRLNDFPPEGAYELIEPESFYEVCKKQVQFFSSGNKLPCPRPDFCFTSRRNIKIDHKLHSGLSSKI